MSDFVTPLPSPAQACEERDFQAFSTDSRLFLSERELEKALDSCDKFPLVYQVGVFSAKRQKQDAIWLAILRFHVDRAGWQIIMEKARQARFVGKDFYELFWVIEPKPEEDPEAKKEK